MFEFPDMGKALLLMALICAVMGWVAVEVLIWLFSHIQIQWI